MSPKREILAHVIMTVFEGKRRQFVVTSEKDLISRMSELWPTIKYAELEEWVTVVMKYKAKIETNYNLPTMLTIQYITTLIPEPPAPKRKQSAPFTRPTQPQRDDIEEMTSTNYGRTNSNERDQNSIRSGLIQPDKETHD